MRERRAIEELRELQRSERVKINELAEAQGLKPFPHEYSTVLVPKDQDTGIFPNHFFTTRYGENEEVVFDEHRIEFPIKDPSQLSKSLVALNAFYSRVENGGIYDRNDPTRFIEFVGGLVEPKQPKA